MPYIADKDRKALDPTIELLARQIAAISRGYGYDGAFAGILNYACTTLAMRVARELFGKMRYWVIAIVTGTFKNIADEFYRRVASPYEDKQIAKSGDIREYQELSEEIGLL